MCMCHAFAHAHDVGSYLSANIIYNDVDSSDGTNHTRTNCCLIRMKNNAIVVLFPWQ
jgi:hypothetical protein